MKKALLAAAIVLVLLAGAALWAYHSIDLIVKVVVEHWGPDVLGAPVNVSQVRISPRTGEGRVGGLEIGNPRGFSARAAKFTEIRVAIDPATVAEEVIVVREISVTSPLIAYERGKEGANLDAIQRNIEAYVKRSSGSGDGQGAKKAARRFIVERLSIRGARVTMTNPALKGQGITFDLPDIELRDVGKRQGGLRASEVANVVANALTSRIAQKLLTNIDLLRRGGLEGAVDALKGLFK